MKKSELRDKIKALASTAYKSVQKTEETAIEYDELTKFPELKAIIVDLLTLSEILAFSVFKAIICFGPSPVFSITMF